jgi:2-succinyl-5-enolpyruvyl-6-hydroxy-3-cyclohexene-1-carboxylate synthase
MSNRGTNGIDGVVSSAFGASIDAPGPVVLAIGDISFYHDSNGLLAAKRHGLDLTVVLINNDGGGIFSFLSQSTEATDEFELLFGTPHGLEFDGLVKTYGGTLERPADWQAFEDATALAISGGGLRVIEVRTNRQHNVEQHRVIWPAVREAVRQALAEVGVAPVR